MERFYSQLLVWGRVADFGIHSKNGIDEPDRWVLGNGNYADRQGESNLLKSALSTPPYIANTKGSVFIEETTFELGFIG